MNSLWKSPKVIAGIATALLMVSLIGFMNVYRVNTSLEGDLKNQKLRSESLLSEKLLLQKDIDKFRSELNSMKGKNSDLDKALAEALQSLDFKESEFKKIQTSNASLKEYKRQYEVLAAMRKQLEETIDGLSSSIAKMQLDNKEMANTIASLEKRNTYLQQELRMAQIASLDQQRIETVKGKKERLTVVARKTRKMKVNVEVPAELKEVTFRVKNPKGDILTPEDGTIASYVIDDGSTVVASADENFQPAKTHKKIEMVYQANKKLEAGIYTVEILSENLYVGSMQVKLK